MNDRTLLLACDGQLAGTTTRKAVFLSSDGGRTWEGGGKLPGTGAIFVAFRSSFVANTGRTGIYTSTDDGRSWQVALASNGAPSTNVLRNAGVWVILHGENDGLWFSADGVHWERRTGATAVDSNSTTTTSTVPSGPIDLGFTRSLSFVDANVGFGVNHYYLVRTDDGGRTWHRVSELQNDLVHFANASDGVAYGGGGMHFTRDGGLHWSAVGDPVESVLGWSDGRLWGFRPCDAGCRSLTPEVSDDGGRTWRAVEGGVQGREVSAFVANSRFTAYTLVVGGTTVSPSLRLASTHDAGATWRYDAVPCSPYEHLFLAASDRSLLLVCGQEPFSGAQQTMRVYTSSDRGSSWTREKAQPSAGNIDGLKSFDSVYFAELGRGDGALSTDNGHSWQLPGFPIVFDEGGLGFSTLPGVGVWAWKVGAAGIWFSADGTHWEKRAGR